MKKMLIPIIAVVVVALGVAAYFLFLAPKGEEPEIDTTAYHTPGDFIVTNIKDSARLMKITVVLALEDDTHIVDQTLTLNEHRIRDIIIFIVRSHTEPELRSDDIREKLTEEIVARLRDELGMDYLKTIYYNDFVLQ